MSQGFPIHLPQRVFDADGAPGVDFKIYTYEAGSDTLLDTYSDAGLTSLNANPIVADASGYFRMFVAEAVLVKLKVYDADDVLQYTIDGLEPMPDTSATSGSVTAVPTGGIIAYGGSSAPTGFLLCDGSLVNRGTQAALFTAIGTAFGAGDGSTTFALPDLRQRFPLGKAASGTGNTLGATGGAIDHVHEIVAPRDDWGSTTTNPNVLGRLLTGLGAGGANDQAADDNTFNSGTANAPFQVVNFIIKT